MELLFVATVSISVITVALMIRSLVLGKWVALRTAFFFMLIGGAVGYLAVNHNETSLFRERLLGVTARIDVLYVYLCVVLAGLLGFLLSSLSKRHGVPG